jgi:hypothetical protein
MTIPVPAEVGCLLVGEYVDEGESPLDLAFGHGEIVRPQVVASYFDHWGKDEGTKEFSVPSS